MIGKEIYKIWAPYGARWTNWIRPVPFVQLNHIKTEEHFNNNIPKISYIDCCKTNMGIIIDLPSYEGVNEGIALAKLGFRPIPIYNGTNGQAGAISTVNNTALELSLIWGGLHLKNITLKDNAPPAFLLDSNRMNRFKMSEKVYDNSWDLYSQDVPTANFLLKSGINEIILRSDIMRKDVAKILYDYQKEGLTIFYTDGYELPKVIKIKKPKKDIKE